MPPHISAIMAVASSDARLRGKVRQIRELEILGKDVEQKLSRLERALERSGGAGANDLVVVPGGLMTPAPAPGSGVDPRTMARVWRRVWALALALPEEAREAVRQRMRAEGLHRRVEVEATMDRLMARCKALTTARSRLLSDLRDVVQGQAKAETSLPRTA